MPSSEFIEPHFNEGFEQFKCKANTDLLQHYRWNNQDIFKMEKIHFLNTIKYCLRKEILKAEDALYLFIERMVREMSEEKTEDVSDLFEDEDLKDSMPF